MKLDTRRRIFALNSKCLNCGNTTNLQIDHIYPKSKGGSDVFGNLQVLCSKCNLKKSNKFQSPFSHYKEAQSW
jgi:5-methylcytosine-specific restriction endonuclease McrA